MSKGKAGRPKMSERHQRHYICFVDRSWQWVEKNCKEYFDNTKPEEWCLTGLAMKLCATKGTIKKASNRKDHPHHDIVKQCYIRLEHAYELRLIRRGNSGDQFALKSLMNWDEKRDQTITIKQDKPNLSKEDIQRKIIALNKEYGQKQING